MTTLVLINPNTNTDTTATMVAALETALPEDVRARVRVQGVTAAAGPAMITTEEQLLAAAEPTVTAFNRCGLAPDSTELLAVVVAAFGDPGLEQLRESLAPVPVIGLGTSAVTAARQRAEQSGTRFGIATTTPALDASLWSLVRACSGGNVAGELGACAGIAYTRTDPNELAGQPELQEAQLREAVAELAGTGATEVIIGGGPLTTSAQRLLASLPVGPDGEPITITVPIVEVARQVAKLART